MIWANDRIRTQYYAAVGQPFSGIAWNSSMVPEDFDRDLALDGRYNQYGVKDIEYIQHKRISFY